LDSAYLIKTLGEHLNAELELSEQGTCSVIFDEDEVIFEEHDRQLFVYAVLGSSVGREEACKELLACSNLGMNTGFASVGLDKGREEFLLYRILSGNLEYVEFQDIMVLFIKALRYWKKWLESYEPGKSAHEAEPSGMDMNFMNMLA